MNMNDATFGVNVDGDLASEEEVSGKWLWESGKIANAGNILPAHISPTLHDRPPQGLR